MINPERLRSDFYFNKIAIINFINLSAKEKETVRSWRNDSTVREWMYNQHTITFKEHKDFIKGLAEDNKNFYWFLKEDEEKYLGVVYLFRVDFKNRNAYLGIYSNKEIKGAGAVLMEYLKKIVFEIAKLHTLKLEVIRGNKRAVNFYKKQMFKNEGRLKDFVFKNGRWQDVIIMGLVE